MRGWVCCLWLILLQWVEGGLTGIIPVCDMRGLEFQAISRSVVMTVLYVFTMSSHACMYTYKLVILQYVQFKMTRGIT